MEYTKHLDVREGKRIKVEKQQKDQTQNWRTSNVKCEIKKKETYFKNKDPGDQENLIAKQVPKSKVFFFFCGSTAQLGPGAPRR